MKHILIFKTSVQDEQELGSLKSILNEVFGEKNWTIALDDIDKVLRIVSFAACRELVIKIFREQGFNCEELPYDLGYN